MCLLRLTRSLALRYEAGGPGIVRIIGWWPIDAATRLVQAHVDAVRASHSIERHRQPVIVGSPCRTRLPRPSRDDGRAATPTVRWSSTATASLSAAGARRGAPPVRRLAYRPASPRLPLHRRPQPHPRQCPRARRHAPDRPQDPRHLRPRQHHQRAGTARRWRPAGRLSGAARTGDAAWRAAPPGPHRRPAHGVAP